ncbi:MAG: T9SS type A sorting domain-containing protein [Bacteroidota bacterium]
MGNIESPPPPPINDECSGAIAIAVDTICTFVTYSSVGATASIGVPAPGCANYLGGDIWFSVVVPASGHLIIDSYNEGIGSSGMAIYSGNCGSLVLITCDANSNINSMPRINQSGLVPGSTIYIRFWKNGSVNGGSFDLCVYEPHGPINDDCSGAIAIIPDTICSYTTYTTVGATGSAGIPAPGCANYSGGDVWFSVIVPASGRIIFDSHNINAGNCGMAIYSGSCGALTLITCNDNGSLNSQMPMINQEGLIPGSTIYLRFWQNYFTVGGTFDLCVYNPPIPINDDCLGAISITSSTTCSYTFYTNIGATASSGIPAPGCTSYAGGDVWFKTIAPASGILIFDSQTAGMLDGAMAIYKGNCDSLILLACDENSSSNGLMPLIYQTGLTPGITIYIRFWRNSYSLGETFGLCVYDPPPPINDDCLGAIPIIVDSICNYITYSNAGATASAGVPAPGCGNYYGGDIWFKAIVPASGHLVFVAEDLGIGSSSMAIYIGNCDTLTLITCNSQSNNISVMPEINQYGLIPGSTVYVRFWKNLNSTVGLFGLCVFEPVPQPTQLACSNLGFENGFIGWYGTVGNPSYGLPNEFTPIYLPTIFNTTSGLHFSLMTGGNDPFGGFPRVFSGTTSLRLGDQYIGGINKAASIEQTFLVTTSNTNFTYNYAVVLQNGLHDYNVQPFFKIDLYDPYGNLIPCGIYSVALPNTAFIQSLTNSDVAYKPWTPISINLSAFLGQTVTIKFTASDCVLGGHFGYAYIDCSCSSYEIIAPGTICQGQSATLSAPVGALSYSWSPGGDTTSSITVSPISTTNYSCLIATRGNTPCYYTLTSTVTVVANTNPVTGSNSLPICSGQTLQLTSSAAGANTYHWTGPNNFVSSDQNPIITNVSNLESGFYKVTSSIGSGCVGRDSVKIIVLPTIANSLNPVICQGNTFTVGQHNYSISGTYYDTLTTILGCDSIITTNLTVGVIQHDTINPIICQGETFTIGTHNYSISGTYSDTLATSLGCDSILTIHLTVQEKQQVSLNPTICLGDTFKVGIHYYTTTGAYTDTIVTAIGCDSIVQTNLIVYPIPPTPVITQVGNVLTSNALVGNQWFNQFGIIVGATNQTYTATIDGDYYDIVTLNGCVSDTSNIRNVMVFIIHVVNTGLEENENNNNGINIYPNPVLDELIIESKGNWDKIEFEIMNSIGQVFFKGSFVEKTIVQTKNFAQGMYMIKLGNGERFEFRKVVKE